MVPKLMQRSVARALCAVTVLTVAATTQADLIGLPLLDAPDLASGFLTSTYDAGPGFLTIDGFALEFDDDGSIPANLITGGVFNLDAVIDDSGEATAGSLAILGNVDGFGPDLLRGNLVDFGFIDGGGQILEFLFEVTGGELDELYGGEGALFGVILDVNDVGYSGDWTESFALSNGVADTAPIPATGVLAVFAGLAFARGRRDRSSAG